MKKLSRNTTIKIAIGIILLPFVIALYQWVIKPVIIWPMEHYYEFRHDYSTVNSLYDARHGFCINGKDGYIAEIFAQRLDELHETDITQINKLTRLHTLRILTGEWGNDEETVCSQMQLLDKIHCESLTELQYDFTKKSHIDCLCVPDSVTTLRIRGSRLTDDDLMKLAKFDQVKEILAYVIFTFNKEEDMAITEEGVKAFNEIRPDVKVWWNGEINEPRKKRDFDIIDIIS